MSVSGLTFGNSTHTPGTAQTEPQTQSLNTGQLEQEATRLAWQNFHWVQQQTHELITRMQNGEVRFNREGRLVDRHGYYANKVAPVSGLANIAQATGIRLDQLG